MEKNEIVSNLVDIFSNFTLFSETFLKIRSKDNCIKQFIFNQEQHYINNLLLQQKSKQPLRALILKGRQVGISTYISARAYHYSLTNRGVRALILSHRQSATNNIFAMIERYHNLMPEFLQSVILKNRNASINFLENDSSMVFATAGSNEVGRSDTIQFFHGSEVAFWANAENHIASILNAVPDNAKSEIILESTSNGPNGLFYEMCLNAQNKNNNYCLIFIPWHWHREYQSTKQIVYPQAWLEYAKIHQLSLGQLSWAYQKNKCLSLQNENDRPSFKFYQEFPASIAEAFKYSKDNILISLESLQLCQQTQDFSKYLVKAEVIILGIDVALGGRDYSWIIDRQGSFLGFNVNLQISLSNTMQLVGLIAEYIKKLKPRYVCIDAGGGGVGVFDRLVELGYKEIMVLVHFASSPQDKRKYLNKRAEMWSQLKDFISNHNYIINDPKLLQQISSVEYFYNSKGQIQLISKLELRKIIKQSPDGGDAASLTFAPIVKNLYSINSVVQSNDFNPFTW